MNQTKVIIIGAGAAGLMAARTLKEQGIDFMILEASHELGGRAQTLKSNPHIEYGPEYLHGNTPITDALVERYSLTTYDVKFDYHIFKNGSLLPAPDFWTRLCDVIGHMHVPKDDISFAEYLRVIDQNSEIDKDMAKLFIEGFDAADLDQISSLDVQAMNAQVCDPQVRRLRRLLNGYGELIENMSQDLLSRIHFSHIAEEVYWQKGHVSVRGAIQEEDIPFEFSANKIINTASIGVLKNLFTNPMPDQLKHFLDQIEMGQVVKMIGEFHPTFFRAFKNDSFPFVAAPDLNFSAWWSATPLHLPIVTAWAGGGRARKITDLSTNERNELYIKELAEISALTSDEVRSQIINIHHRSWNEDPSFLGAYSYPKIHGEFKTEFISSFEDTLFFAGEAFHQEMSGTVEGALMTGKQAAEKVSTAIMREESISRFEQSL